MVNMRMNNLELSIKVIGKMINFMDKDIWYKKEIGNIKESFFKVLNRGRVN